jgi:hypothetical protein
MRLRLLMRRLTVSAPRMAVRSALPWPIRWVLLALVAGFCAAIAVWAFEFGKDIAGLDGGSKQQLQQLQTELQNTRAQLDLVMQERNKAQSIANTADTILTTEKVAHQKLQEQNRLLEQENQRLKDDLGFFEQLIPTSSAGSSSAILAIRSLQAERLQSGELKWQVLVIQALKNPTEFNGQLEVAFTGVLNGKPWTGNLPTNPQALQIKQYVRLAGVYQVPAQVDVRSMTVKVLDGKNIRAMQTVKLTLSPV